MKIDLLYGRSHLAISVPSDTNVHVIRKREMPLLADPKQGVQHALDHPTMPTDAAEGSFELMAQNAKTACIAICDITRPVPNGLFLRPLIERLTSFGMPLSNITILVATGLHRPNVGEELEELVGDPWVTKHVRILNHDARNDAEHVDLGKTDTHGTPVKIDRRFVEADLRIATGLVEPHFMAGYSGGRKVIAPGLAHADTITTFHSHRFMDDSNARNCNLHQNPLHEEQLEILKKLGGALAINTVIDEDRRLAMIDFGEIIASHRLAVDFVKQYCRVPVDQLYETVITSGAGYPLDKTYYQTVKGMVGALGALAPGGNLIVASECGEGLGSKEYISAQQRLIEHGVDRFLQSITNKPNAAIDEWQTQMQTKAMLKGKIHLHCALDDKQFDLTAVTKASDLDSTIRECISNSNDRSVAVIPEGPYVIPYLEQELANS